MDQGLLDSLLDAIHTVLPDAEYVDGENVQFLDSCGCYSEYTTETVWPDCAYYRNCARGFIRAPAIRRTSG